MLKKLAFLILIVFHCVVLGQHKEIKLLSWNIKDFGRTKNSEELNEIAEIVRDADILAIQEVVAGYGGAQAVAKLADILNRKGAKWDYVISDPTNSPKYITERYAIVWKTNNIKIKNRGWLVSELDSLVDREPFLLDLYVEGNKFTLINFHSRPYNKDPESEIIALSNFIIDSLETPLIIAGDFNVDEKIPVFDFLKDNGFKAAISNAKTTLKRKCDGTDYLNHPIDNIFYSQDIYKTEGKTIDFVKFCDELEDARKLSDHLPVLLRFKIN
ncbi:endonuclease/exonuclease/phosphatase family protein [Allomuricauda sp. ARW1Y1]|jgi:endonuclease/exonuclease/phosphatase family metal-dependent hydrolase|uniref:endonuclease/exonuclease/phosphatase family protein n=1 Tax=Allomuricauda sp. ARW1Y1 TaxID=2663843 RepID=UPI0015CE73EF|nr:endonuclease/exonuclease/phosphatase family protein [Muricauda sp. ARW1Y1]NYJ28602.1 endonuclease/exonuclease/phosphatase family metal-dependent hydrolase [Muricauda sp. ARW1Y1]